MDSLPWQIAALNLGLIWSLKITALVLGYLCVRLGHHLISSGVKGEFEFTAKGFGAHTALKAVSPGLLFVVLGVALMAYSVSVEKIVTVESSSISAAPEVPLPASTGSKNR